MSSPESGGPNAEMAEVLRNMKIPLRMTNSHLLREFLLDRTERNVVVDQNPEEIAALNGLLVLSHLEVVNALGAIEEAIAIQTIRRPQKKKPDDGKGGFLKFLRGN